MKIIFKNLWNRRRANVWLFVELIIVSILTWVIADKIVMSIYDTSLPNGYDNERMAIITINSLSEDDPQYNSASDSADMRSEAVRNIMTKIRAYTGVEYATNMYNYAIPGGSSNYNTSYTAENPVNDSVYKFAPAYMLVPADENIFQTFGIEVEAGSPSAAELSERDLAANNEVVITRRVADAFWPGQNAVGKRLMEKFPWDQDTTYLTIVGVVENVRWTTMSKAYTLVFCGGEKPSPINDFTVVVRLKDNTDVDNFVADFRANAKQDLRVGNYRFKSIISYNDMIADTEEGYGVHNDRRQAYLLSIFFLLSLLLGTIGCFWLQGLRRVEEIGIRRSFGAVRSDIVRMIVGEAVVMSSVAVLIGIILYLQYALKSGLNQGLRQGEDLLGMSWATNFWLHFAVISLIVYLIIIFCVVVGTMIPALKAARVNVTDALRDE